MSSVESLEPRTLFTVFVVNTLADTVACDGKLSLREAIIAANTNKKFHDAAAGSCYGDTIKIADSLFGQTIKLDGKALVISDKLTIENGFRIDADGRSQAIVITKGKVDLNGIVLEHGSGGTGGALSIIGNAKVHVGYSSIIDSLATGSGGGGIYVGKCASLEINNSLISRNMAVGSDKTNGGAIYAESKTLTITDCVFDRNYATGYGGAIYADTCSFKMSGGAVRENATFSAGGTGCGNGGGGIAFVGKEAVITGASILGNSVILSHLNGGGGIFNTGKMKLVDCDINNNGACGEAGYGGGIQSDCDVTISKTDLLGNVAVRSGGGVYGKGKLQVDDCVIEQNVACENGGGAALDASCQSTFSNTAIRSNATRTGNGGGVWSAIAAGKTLNGCDVSANFAGGHGGDICNEDELAALLA